MHKNTHNAKYKSTPKHIKNNSRIINYTKKFARKIIVLWNNKFHDSTSFHLALIMLLIEYIELYVSILSPPIKSRTKVFALVKANMAPINRSLDIMLEELYSIENITIKIKLAKTSIKIRDIKHLIQDLKIKEVERVASERIAKGESKIKTFIKMYLIE